jgi:hypothetical protein
MGVNPDNRRVDDAGVPFHLFCSYFYSYPSANMRLTCSHHEPGDVPNGPAARLPGVAGVTTRIS